MIFTSQTPRTFDDSPLGNYDVVIIGGGVIGICTAWFLAGAGKRVAVCEKGRIAGEQSSRNWGWVRQQGRDEAELPIMMESNRIWQTLAEQVGEDLGFQQRGVMYVAESEKEMARYQEWVELAGRHELASTLLTAGEVRKRVRGFTGNWQGGVETPSDGRAEPFVVVPALARACQRRGVTIAEQCAVRGLSVTAGRVAGVVTEHGEIHCDAVVCAGGAWSSLLMGHLGIAFPQLSVKATVARTAPTPEFYGGNAACEDLALRRRQDGGYTLAPAAFHEHYIGLDSFRYMKPFIPTLVESWKDTKLRVGSDAPGGFLGGRRWQEDRVTPFEQNRVLNPVPTPSTLKLLRKKFEQRLPEIRELPFVESWSGMIDSTPDVLPVMDQLSKMPGLFLASGFSGHGFGIGPGAGRVMADLVQGNPVGHDLSRFRFARFSDGSKLKPGPTL